MAPEENTRTINKLPPELLYQIFYSLETNSMLKVRLVCKTWDRANSPIFWRRLVLMEDYKNKAQKTEQEYYDYFQQRLALFQRKSIGGVEMVLVCGSCATENHYFKKFFENDLANATFERLETFILYSEDQSAESRFQLIRLESDLLNRFLKRHAHIIYLCLENVKIPYSFEGILENFPRLETLFLTCCAIEAGNSHVKSQKALCHPLKKLKLDEMENPLPQNMFLQNFYLHNLESLYVTGWITKKFWGSSVIKEYHGNETKNVVRLPNLRNLVLYQASSDDLLGYVYDVPKLTGLRLAHCIHNFEDEILDLLPCSQLTSLDLLYSNNDALDRRIVTVTPNLKEFYFVNSGDHWRRSEIARLKRWRNISVLHYLQMSSKFTKKFKYDFFPKLETLFVLWRFQAHVNMSKRVIKNRIAAASQSNGKIFRIKHIKVLTDLDFVATKDDMNWFKDRVLSIELVDDFIYSMAHKHFISPLFELFKHLSN